MDRNINEKYNLQVKIVRQPVVLFVCFCFKSVVMKMAPKVLVMSVISLTSDFFYLILCPFYNVLHIYY